MTDKLMISRCVRCKSTAWPPQESCRECFADTRVVQASDTGTIVGFSKKDDVYFCVADFDGIRIMCSLCSQVEPVTGQRVRFDRYHTTKDGHAFEITLL